MKNISRSKSFGKFVLIVAAMGPSSYTWKSKFSTGFGNMRIFLSQISLCAVPVELSNSINLNVHMLSYFDFFQSDFFCLINVQTSL